MELRVLDDEEIRKEDEAYSAEVQKIYDSNKPRDVKLEEHFELESVYKRIAKAQHQQDLKDFVEWLENKYHPVEYVANKRMINFRMALEDFQSLKQLVEKKGVNKWKKTGKLQQGN